MQKRYGKTREAAEKTVDEWFKRAKNDHKQGQDLTAEKREETAGTPR